MKLLIGLVLIVLLAGCTIQTTEQQKTETSPTPTISPTTSSTPQPTMEKEETELIVSVKEFELNKEVYSSKEDFNARAVIESNKRVTGVEVRVSGIKVGSGTKIYRAEFTDLEKGENEFFFTQKTPSCTSGCGGVYPGMYEVKVQVLREKKVLAEQVKEIELIE